MDYLMTSRAVKDKRFINEPSGDGGDVAQISYLAIPDGKDDFAPGHAIPRAKWIKTVQDLAAVAISPNSAAIVQNASGSIALVGDLLVFVHGYNNSTADALAAQRALAANLRNEGWRGLVVGFDWPSANSVLNYLEDRSDAQLVARQLIDEGIRPLSMLQSKGCLTNVHLLGHSTGAFVIVEAVTQSLGVGGLFKSAWRLGQVAFIAADVSSDTLNPTSVWIKPLQDRMMRLTNYSNGHDKVLAVSNAKRLGTQPRAGRVGAQENADIARSKIVNVDCSTHFGQLDPADYGINTYMDSFAFSHSWYFHDAVFARDLAMTLEGAIDRASIPTRKATPNMGLELVNERRPRLQRHLLDNLQ